MTTYNDTFIRADENPITAPWIQAKGCSGMRILSNVAKGLGATHNGAYYTGTFTADQFSEITYTGVPGDAAVVRFITSGSTMVGYAAYISSATVLQLHRLGVGIIGANIGVGLVAGDKVRLEVVGTTLQVLVNGNVLRSATDANIAEGSPGIYTYGTTATIGPWEGGDLAALTVAGDGLFYLDSEVETSGNGTAAAPWKLWANVSWYAVLGIVTAGYTPRIKLSGSWDEPIAPSVGTTGTADHPIKIEPLVVGSKPECRNSAGTIFVFDTNRSYFHINQIKLAGWAGANSKAVQASTGANHIELNHCLIDGEGDLSDATQVAISAVTATSGVKLNHCTVMRTYTASKTSAIDAECKIEHVNCDVLGTWIPFSKAAGSTLTIENSRVAAWASGVAQTADLVGAGNKIYGVGGNTTGALAVTNHERFGTPKCNISIDDKIEFADLDTVFAARGAYFPTNNLTGYNCITEANWDDVRANYNAGFEYLCHGFSHSTFITARDLFDITYVGAGTECFVEVTDTHFITRVDEEIHLNLPITSTVWGSDGFLGDGTSLAGLIKTIHDHESGDYTCTPVGTPVYVAYIASRALDIVNDVTNNIKTASHGYGHTTRERGLKADWKAIFANMTAEISIAKGATSQWVNPVYSYPADTGNDGVARPYILESDLGYTFTAARGAGDGGSTYGGLIAGIDIAYLPCESPSYLLSDANLKAHAVGKLLAASLCGRVCTFYGHESGTNLSAAQWGIVLDGIIESGAEYSTWKAIVEWLYTQTQDENFATNRIIRGTTDAAIDLRPTAGSPVLEAGAVIADYPLTEDINGVTLNLAAPDIGAYQYEGEGSTSIPIILNHYSNMRRQ